MSDTIYGDESPVFKKLDGFLKTATAYVGKHVKDDSEYVVVFIYQYPDPENPAIFQIAKSNVYVYTDEVKQEETTVSVDQVLAYMNCTSRIAFDRDEDASTSEDDALLDQVDFEVYCYDEEASDEGYITVAVGLKTFDKSISIPSGTFDVRIYE